MAELALHFEMTKDTDLTHAATSLEERLTRLPSVQEVAALPEKPRFTGLEIMAAIAITVKFVHEAHEIVHDTKEIVHDMPGIVEDLRKFIQQVRNLIGNDQGVKNITVDVGPATVPISELTEAHLQQLAKAQVQQLDEDAEDEA